MKKLLIIFFLCNYNLAYSMALDRLIDLAGEWKFAIGDDNQWKEHQYNDVEWEKIYVPSPWENQGFNGYDGFAWYRKSFHGSKLNGHNSIYLKLGHIDDADEVYINGQLIGFSGKFPPHFKTAYQQKRVYYIPKSYINKYGQNTIAIRVYDAVLGGGIISGDIGIYKSALDIPNQFILEGVWEMKMNRWRSRRTRQFANWNHIMVPQGWDYHGIRDYNDVAWYRKYFNLPKDFSTSKLTLILGKIDDFDEVYINGIKVGETNDYRPFGESQSWQQTRIYKIPPGCLKTNDTNVIMVKVTDIGVQGGIYAGPILIIPSSYTSQVIRSF